MERAATLPDAFLIAALLIFCFLTRSLCSDIKVLFRLSSTLFAETNITFSAANFSVAILTSDILLLVVLLTNSGLEDIAPPIALTTLVSATLFITA